VTTSITIGRLARLSSLSRSTLLYYDRLGLVRPTGRSQGDYRLYGEADVQRLRQVCLYRQMGVPLKQIALLLDHDQTDRREQILRGQLESLAAQITALQGMQRQILGLLEQITALDAPRTAKGGSRPKAGRKDRASASNLRSVPGPRRMGNAQIEDTPAGRRRPRPGARPATSAHCPSPSLTEETNMVNKQRWCEIMRAAGFSDQQMRTWHQQFEALEPDNHQEFLELLGIAPDEIQKIRHWSRGA